MNKNHWNIKVLSMFFAFSLLVLLISSPDSTFNTISSENTNSRVLETEYYIPDADEISKSMENQKEINALIANYGSVFPESYAGAYYDYKKDKLIMCLTDNSEYDYFQEYFKSDLVEYKYVKYSYDYLLSFFNLLTEEVFNKYQLNSAGDDIFNNCIKVSIPDKSIINDFDEFLSQNGFDTNAVRYVIEEKTENPAT